MLGIYRLKVLQVIFKYQSSNEIPGQTMAEDEINFVLFVMYTGYLWINP